MSTTSDTSKNNSSQRKILSKAVLNHICFSIPDGNRISRQALNNYMKRHLQIINMKKNIDLNQFSLDVLSYFDNEHDNLINY